MGRELHRCLRRFDRHLGSGPDDVWAIGGGAPLHWDGSTWTPDNTGGTVNYFQAIWGIAPNFAFAVGAGELIKVWNGSTWSPLHTGATNGLTAVWGTASTDAWAVGYDGARHWNGTSWTVVTTPANTGPLGIWGTAANDIWIVGGATLHWDGSAWFAIPSGASQALNGVWGSGPNDVWAVGDHGTIVHWDGSAWTSASTMTTTVQLHGVWGSGPDDVWVVGYQPCCGALLHWNGSVLVPNSAPVPALLGVWGSGPSDVWTVGLGGTIRTGTARTGRRARARARTISSPPCGEVGRTMSGRLGRSAARRRPTPRRSRFTGMAAGGRG